MSALKNWGEEKQSAYLYRLVAAREKDPTRIKLFLELADSADKQALLWMRQLPEQVADYRPDFRTRLVGWMVRWFHIKQVRYILSAMKVRGMSVYAGVPNAHTATSHLESRHKGIGSAGNLRAAVFGVNDGLISNLSLLLGIVGANAPHDVIVLSGIAGLLAGACSMAAGEYISVRSQREFFEYQIQLEKEELDLYPEEEAAELACIYRARGLPKDEAKKLADYVISQPEKALDTLAREELGLNPAELGSPWGAAISSFISFALGALIPLAPFLLGHFVFNIGISIGLTALALIFIGAVLSLYTNRSAWMGSLRMLFIGFIAGTSTYMIGKLVGVVLY